MAIVARHKEVSRASSSVVIFNISGILSQPVLCCYICHCSFLYDHPKIASPVQDSSLFPRRIFLFPLDWSSAENLVFAGKYAVVQTSSCPVSVLLDSKEDDAKFSFCKTGLVMQIRLISTCKNLCQHNILKY